MANGDETIWVIGSIISTRWMAIGPTGIYETRDLVKGSWKRTGPSLGEEISVRPQPLTVVTIDRNTFVNLDGAVFRSGSWEKIFRGGAEVFRLSGKPHVFNFGWVIASRDGGHSWTDTIRPDSAERGGRMFLGTADVLATGGAAAYLSNGWKAYRTRDGRNFERVPGVLLGAGYSFPPDSLSPSIRATHLLHGDTLYALITTGALFRSRDFGATWDSLPGRITTPRGGAARLFAAGGAVWISGEGMTCRLRPGLAVCDSVPSLPEAYSIAEEGGLLAAATSKGVWRSTDQGRTWEPASAIPVVSGEGPSGEPDDRGERKSLFTLIAGILIIGIVVSCIAVLIRNGRHAPSHSPNAGREVLGDSLSPRADLARASEHNLNLENSVGRELKIFISYAHEDERLKGELEKRLKIIGRECPIAPWSDRDMLAGTLIHDEILKRLEGSDMTLLLISPDFVASDYCWTKEMEIALEQYKHAGKVPVPIIVRWTPHWHNSKIGKHLALPRDGKPLSDWPNADDFWGEVEKGLRGLIRNQLG